jgi:hypothetical protein
MNQLLKELLPNPTFVDYQDPKHVRGEDFYNEERMLAYGRRIVQECADRCRQSPYPYPNYSVAIMKHFGVEE